MLNSRSTAQLIQSPSGVLHGRALLRFDILAELLCSWRFADDLFFWWLVVIQDRACFTFRLKHRFKGECLAASMYLPRHCYVCYVPLTLHNVFRHTFGAFQTKVPKYDLRCTSPSSEVDLSEGRIYMCTYIYTCEYMVHL